jgi:SAM-dependent methyltransferase
MKVLELGCGAKKRKPTSIGLDLNAHPGVNIRGDAGSVLPFADDSFDRVESYHLLEHLDDMVAAFDECHRVLKPGGTLFLEVPHFSCVGGFADPTHKRSGISLLTLEYFLVDSRHKDFSYTDRRWTLLHQRISFNKSLLDYVPKFLYFVSVKWYEKHFAFMFPARSVFAEMKVVK